MKKQIILPLLLLGLLGLSSCNSDVPGPAGPVGQTGEKGETGEKGDKGEIGDVGADGSKGDQGEKGESGADGIDGTTVLNGPTDPTFEVGKLNDIYINTTTWDVFTKAKDSWTLVGNIKGEKGEPGQAGGTGSDGQDGFSASIGPNGNWFVGNVDTGIAAKKDETNDPNVTDGLEFELFYKNHKPYYKITNYTGSTRDVILPNTLNNIPVTEFANNIFKNIQSLKLTPNIEKLGTLHNSMLKTIDFNGAKVKTIPSTCFLDCWWLRGVYLSDSVETIEPNAFQYTNVSCIDLKNVKTIGENAFSDYMINRKSIGRVTYIPKTVKKIDDSFNGHGCVYLEVTEEEYAKGGYDYNISNTKYFGVIKKDNLLYGIENGEAVFYQDYHPYSKDLVIASEVNGLPVTTIKEKACSDIISNNDLDFNLFRAYWDYDKIIIPNTVKKIEENAFLNVYTGYVYLPLSIETNLNASKMFNDNARIYYAGTREKLDNLQFNLGNSLIYTDVNKSDLVDFDGLLLRKFGENYNFEGFLKNAKDFTTFPESYNNIQITGMSKKSFRPHDAHVIRIPNSVTKFEDEAIDCSGEVYINGSNTNYIFGTNSIKCRKMYLKVNEKPASFEGNIITKTPEAYSYNVDDIGFYNNFVYLITTEENGLEASIIRFIFPPVDDNFDGDIKVPRYIGDIPVRTLLAPYLDTEGYIPFYNYYYIPKEVTYIEPLFMPEKPINNMQYFYLECSKDFADTHFAPNWCGCLQQDKVEVFYNVFEGFDY